MILVNRSAERPPSSVVSCAHRVCRRTHYGAAIVTQIEHAQRAIRNRLELRPNAFAHFCKRDFTMLSGVGESIPYHGLDERRGEVG